MNSTNSKPRIAIFSPLNPIRSGVSDYTRGMAEQLRSNFDISFVVEEGFEPSYEMSFGTTLSCGDFKFDDFDITIYHLGNNAPYHTWILKYALQFPGVVVLHDGTLYYPAKRYYRSISRAKYFSTVLKRYGVLNFFRAILGRPDKMHLHFLDDILRISRRVIVHNTFMLERICKICETVKADVIPLGIDKVVVQRSKRESREFLSLSKYGVENDSFIVMSFGFIQSRKRIKETMIAFSRFHRRNPNSFLIFCGQRSSGVDIEQLASTYGVSDNVIVDDSYPPFDVVYEYINASDLCVNLRWPDIAAGSASVLTMMAVGKPCIVTKIPSLEDIPDGCLFRVEKDEREIERVVEIMEEIRARPELGDEVGIRAKKFIEGKHTWEQVGPLYIEILRRELK